MFSFIAAQALYPTVRDETFLMSCGVADLIATCYGGRNRLVAEAWTKAALAGRPATFEQLEKVGCRYLVL
jgi:glycerol-3-phosphate dehydrogenase (NAD+)